MSDFATIGTDHYVRQQTYFLVYQAGIANVFRVRSANLAPYGRDAERIIQLDFKTCENVARGLALGGHIVHTAHCNECGDIVDRTWSEDLDEAPFRESMNPVYQTKYEPQLSRN